MAVKHWIHLPLAVASVPQQCAIKNCLTNIFTYIFALYSMCVPMWSFLNICPLPMNKCMFKIGLRFVANFIRITRHCINSTNQCAWLSSPSSYSPGNPFTTFHYEAPPLNDTTPPLSVLAKISVLNALLILIAKALPLHPQTTLH